MTHSLFRTGSRESLAGDYVMLIATDKLNSKGSCSAIKRFFDLCVEHGCVSIGEKWKGSSFVNPLNDLKESIKDGTYVYTVFDDLEKFRNLIRALKEEDLGYSVVATGITDVLLDICREIGIKPHSIKQSIGTFGNIDSLPSELELELITMCGHMYVNRNLIQWVLGEIKENNMSFDEAAQVLAKPCTCGIFNIPRAKKILEKIVTTTAS